MIRLFLVLALLLIPVMSVSGAVKDFVVADSATHVPLPNASVLDRNGKIVAITDSYGKTNGISANSFPVSITYLGFRYKEVLAPGADTIFMHENVSELPEVVFESRGNRILHILAYVRDYSVMSTYTDTVYLFREKMVDFMLPADKKIKFKGWTKPRVLTSKSYYRFTNSNGLDSVSDVSNHHFSWSDWMGVAPSADLPHALTASASGTDTLRGKYGPSEIWSRNGDKVNIDINVIADQSARRWVPNFNLFFQNHLDFESFKLHLHYTAIDSLQVSPMELDGYSFEIESNGRGHDMFRFNKVNESFFVTTRADVYLLDKEYITLKEARKWENRKFDIAETGIFEPMDAPALEQPVMDLIARVNSLDIEKVRLNEIKPDPRLMSRHSGRENMKVGHRALIMLKQLTGISRYKFKRNLNRRWNQFRDEQKQRNKPE